MSNSNTAQLIFGPLSMHNHTKRNHDPRQKRCAEDEQAQETKLDVWVAATPDIDQCAAKDGTQKDDRHQGSETE